jgi:hypothetical protein
MCQPSSLTFATPAGAHDADTAPPDAAAPRPFTNVRLILSHAPRFGQNNLPVAEAMREVIAAEHQLSGTEPPVLGPLTTEQPTDARGERTTAGADAEVCPSDPWPVIRRVTTAADLRRALAQDAGFEVLRGGLLWQIAVAAGGQNVCAWPADADEEASAEVTFGETDPDTLLPEPEVERAIVGWLAETGDALP